jgi:hypothetical protein
MGPFQVEVEAAAQTLARDGRLADAFGKGTGPTAHVPPLYTALVAGIHATLGVDSHAAVLVQRLLSCVVCALGIALMPWVAIRCGLSLRSGLIAGLILALYPFYWFLEVYGRQETVYSVLLNILLLTTWLRLRDDGWRGRWQMVLLGILTGLAALTSPQLLALVGLALLLDLTVSPADRLRVLQGGVVVVLVSTLMVAPWAYRNLVVLGGFVPLRSNFGLELFIGNNPSSDGHTYTIPYSHPNDPRAWPHPFRNPDEQQHLREVGELTYMREKGEIAKEWIRENPGRFLKLTGSRLLHYYFPPASYWSPEWSIRPLRAAAAWGISLLGLCGLVLVFTSKLPNRWPLLLVLVAPTLVYLVTHVNMRYRYGSMWILALLAGHALSLLTERVPPRRSGRGFCAEGNVLVGPVTSARRNPSPVPVSR